MPMDIQMVREEKQNLSLYTWWCQYPAHYSLAAAVTVASSTQNWVPASIQCYLLLINYFLLDNLSTCHIITMGNYWTVLANIPFIHSSTNISYIAEIFDTTFLSLNFVLICGCDLFSTPNLHHMVFTSY